MFNAFIVDAFNEYLTDVDAEPERIRLKRLSTWNYFLDMLNRTQTMFDWHGLPDTIPQRNLELILQTCGNVCITKVEGDLYAFWGGLGGVPDVYYEPTIYTVANPALNYSAELKIGTDCVRMRNDATGQGLTPIFMRYAPRLTENDISMNIMDINYRIGNLISASDDQTAESARQYLDDIISGKLGIVSESEFFDGIKVAQTGRSGENIKDLIEYHQYLKASWYNDLGVNANYNMKRERINPEESGLNEDALTTLTENMLECRRIACDQINEMYSTDISVDLAGAWLKEQKAMQIEGVDFDTDKDNNINEDIPDDSEEAAGSEEPAEADPDTKEDTEDQNEEPETSEAAGEEEEAGDHISVEVNIDINTDGEEVNTDDETQEPEPDDSDMDNGRDL